MKRSGSKLLCILLVLSLLLSLTACGKPETQLEKTAGYLQAQIAEPGTGSVGGDWLIFGLARSGVKVPQKYFDAYYENVEAAVREKNGVLSDRKYTEYSRTVLALTAIGKNPADVAGFDLLKPLADFEQVTRQGINGTIFALLALGLRVIFAYALHNTALFGYTAVWWSQAMAWTVTLLVCYAHVFRGKWKNKSLI